MAPALYYGYIYICRVVVALREYVFQAPVFVEQVTGRTRQ